MRNSVGRKGVHEYKCDRSAQGDLPAGAGAEEYYRRAAVPERLGEAVPADLQTGGSESSQKNDGTDPENAGECSLLSPHL